MDEQMGLKVFQPEVFSDERGFFLESYRADLMPLFVQDNHSFSKKGVIRGMHAQEGQAKLVRVVLGEIFDVAVDVRKESKTFGKWFGIVLDDKTHKMLYIPEGFAHGFCVLKEAHVCYKVSTLYDPLKERAFRYDDPDVGIKWPILNPILSKKDANAPTLSELL